MCSKTPATVCMLLALIGAGKGKAAESDALAILATIQARHLPYGTVMDPIFASPANDQIIGYTRCGDSAIWTGHYLAAEAFRYKLTGATDALNNVVNAIAGLKALVDVTGTDVLARCAVPLDSPYAAGIQSEESDNGIYTNRGAGKFWVGNTSRDQYMGAFFGLAVAYDMVSDAGVQASASDLVTRMLVYLSNLGWTVVMPDGSISTTFIVGPHEVLSMMQVGSHVNPVEFLSAYQDLQDELTPLVGVPIDFDVQSDESYFKFNLDSIAMYNLIRLQTGTPSSDYQSAYKTLRAHTAPQQNAFFDIIDRALSGPDAARDNETLALLDEWLQRPRRDVSVNLQDSVAVCRGQACQPLPVPLRVPTDYLWQRSPYQLAGGGDGVIEGAGIDYILPYWMARYYGVAAGFAVQSSATNRYTVAPDSLGTLYGTGLASMTAAAGGQPLPEFLGGVNLTVTDSLGVARPAPLLYVSPGQINFQVPDGTISGPATFTVNNGSATALTGSTAVANVTPALFTVNSTGEGLAAATAIQVQNGEQTAVPVFQCDATGCQATPIALRPDVPVYLTLYGTGLRNRSGLTNVQVNIYGTDVPVLYAGPQPQFAGLDQVNVELPPNLSGSGLVNVALTVDGQAANIVTIDIQ